MPQLARGRSGRVAAACVCLLVALTACGRAQDTTAADPTTSTSSASATPTAKPTSATPTSTPSPTSPATTAPPVPDRQPHTLVLKAEGSGDITITSFKYTLDGKVKRAGPAGLPWRTSLLVPADGLPHSFTLEVEHKGPGRFQLFAIYDGEVKARTDGWGTGTGNFTGTAGISGAVHG